jgi:hypothetical protein
MHGHDVRMGERRGHPRLAEKPLAQVVDRSEFGREDLDRHRAVEPRILGEPDGAHATASQFALEPVGIAEGRLQGAGEIGHQPWPPRNVPHSARSASLISPSVARTRTAAMIGGSSESVVRAT